MQSRPLCAIVAALAALALCSVPAVAEPGLVDQEVGAGGTVVLERGADPATRLPRRLRLELARIAPSPALGSEPVVVRRRTKRHGSESLALSVGRLPAGVYHVREVVAGGEYGRDFGNLAIQPPLVAEPDVVPLRAGTVIGVAGRFFGPRLARVRLGSKRVKVLRQPRDGYLRVRLPRRLADGEYPLSVETPAGLVTAIAPVRIGTALHRLATRDLAPTADYGFAVERGISQHDVHARPRDQGLVEIVLGAVDARRGFTRLTFAIPDVFDESFVAPQAVRAAWVVVQQRTNDAERESIPDAWYREDGLIVTVLAYDEPSGFLIAEFTGGLGRVDEFGTPIPGASVQIRGGRVEAFLRRAPPAAIASVFELEFDHPSVLDPELSTAVLEYGRIQPSLAEYENAVGVTRWFDLGDVEPEFLSAFAPDLRLGAPEGSALLLEIQAAPAVEPSLPVLSAHPDASRASAWLPLYLYDRQGTPEGAFADLGLLRSEIGFEEYFPVDDLNGQGHRLLRLRITLRMLEEPYVTPNVSGPVPFVDEIKLQMRLAPPW